MISDTHILRIANRDGCFTISRRYRSDKLREQCRQLVLAGKLKLVRQPNRYMLLFKINEHYTPTHEDKTT